MTVAEELLEEGRVEGRVQGRVQGRVECRQDVALELLVAGVDDAIVMRVGRLDQAGLEQLKRKLHQA